MTFPHLYAVAFAVSTLTAIASLASIALLPALVPKAQLVEANSRLATTDAALTIAAPNIAGSLIQVIGAPKAILVNAVSYVLSALTLRRLHVVEAVRCVRDQRRAMWREIGEGRQELVRTPALRALTLAVSVGTFGTAMQGTVVMLFAIHVLGFSPVTLGLLGACAGIGTLGGAACAGRVTDRLGIGPAIIVGNLLWALGALVDPFAQPGAWAVPLVGAGATLANFGASLWSVGQMSLRQHPIRTIRAGYGSASPPDVRHADRGRGARRGPRHDLRPPHHPARWRAGPIRRMRPLGMVACQANP